MGLRCLAERVKNRTDWIIREFADVSALVPIRLFHRWPCRDRKLLLVGSESSGSTAIAKLLFLSSPSLRFLEEGYNQWVWNAYRQIYQGRRSIRDYPRLQLFDTIKVPGFATILRQFKESFPNSKIVYIVRDPRDFVNSAIKTWKVGSVAELTDVSWSKENWLGIQETDPVIRLALRWRTYLRCAESVPDVIFVRYEDFCADKPGTIQDLATAMEIPYDLDRVIALQNQQLSHVSVRDYKPAGPGGWRLGILEPQHINKIESACQAEMSRWHYQTANSQQEK